MNPQPAVLFVNPRSGGGTASRTRLAERARELGIETFVLGRGDDLAAIAQGAAERGAEVLGVAGGDGTLAVVAAVAAEYDLPFVCVPTGTRNHFALDLGLDRTDPLGSLAAFTDGVEHRIDVGDVNGRLFLNNVSLGVYGDAVREPGYRDAKALTLFETATRVLGPSAPAPGLQLLDERGWAHREPAVVLVSNNPYAVEPPHAVGTRASLEGGQLGVLVLGRPLAAQPPGRTWTATSLIVTASEALHAGIDGEAVALTPPLKFTIRPRALRVRLPNRRDEEARRPYPPIP